MSPPHRLQYGLARPRSTRRFRSMAARKQDLTKSMFKKRIAPLAIVDVDRLLGVVRSIPVLD